MVIIEWVGKEISLSIMIMNQLAVIYILLVKYIILPMGMCRIMVYQTMALSGSEKPANQGYVNLTHNFKVVMDFISKICKNKICRNLNLVSKLLGLI